MCFVCTLSGVEISCWEVDVPATVSVLSGSCSLSFGGMTVSCSCAVVIQYNYWNKII